MNIIIPDGAASIIQRLMDKGFEAYVVGGCVRDSLLGKTPDDWDITTSASPTEMMLAFEGLKVIPIGLQHGTLAVLVNDVAYEVTTYRIDGKYSDGRRPDDVTFTKSLKEDLSRRDFTVNALAYSPETGIIDYFGGVDDLRDKVVKCVGDPVDRFDEDGLRIMRAIRFACKLNFRIQANTLYGIIQTRDNIKNISVERIREELCKILLSDNFRAGFSLMYITGLMDIILPELSKCACFEQHNGHHDKDVYEHIIAVVGYVPNRLDLRLAALLHDIAKPLCFTVDQSGEGHFYHHHMEGEVVAREILTRLKFDNRTIDKVCLLVREHMSRYDFLRQGSIKKFINRVGADNLDDLFELQIADIKGCSESYRNFDNVTQLKEDCEKILSQKQPLTTKDLDINGHDLLSLGYKQGVEIGAKLKELLEIVLNDPEMNVKEKLLKYC